MRTITARSSDVALTEFDTLDEAIAEALAQVTDGGVVAIHDEDCKHDGENESSCTCTPLELVKGAAA